MINVIIIILLLLILKFLYIIFYVLSVNVVIINSIDCNINYCYYQLLSKFSRQLYFFSNCYG